MFGHFVSFVPSAHRGFAEPQLPPIRTVAF